MNPSRAPRIWSSLACVLTLALGAPPARAQAKAEDKAAAESLFRRALELMDRDQAAEACPLFEEVFRITGGLGAEFELARCYETTGRLASAWATYREVGQRDRGRRAVEARAAANRLEPELTRLTVEVPAAAAALPQFQVFRDGRPLMRQAWGVPIPVDPGEHRVEAVAKDDSYWGARITLAKGGNRSIVIGTLAEGARPEGSPAIPQPPDEVAAPSTRGHAQRLAGLGIGGVGLVGLGAGLALGLNAKSKYDDQRDSGACQGTKCSTEGDQASGEARSQGSLGTVVGGLGLAALIGGFVLYATAPSAATTTAARSTTLTWQPSVGRNAASLGLSLRW
jgi:hypothetical protein